MRVVHHQGSTAELHALGFPDHDEPEAWVLEPTRRSVAMGSAQRPETFDTARLAADSVELAPRRSGGGAVYIDPAATVWIDVLAPRSSRWWSDDLTQTFRNVGECWQAALNALGVPSELIDRGPEKTPQARLACWAGLGWGELTVDGVKIVGLSQRRTRWGARIQAMAVIDGSAGRVADYFVDLEPLERQEIRQQIGELVLPVSRTDLERAVLTALQSDRRS